MCCRTPRTRPSVDSLKFDSADWTPRFNVAVPVRGVPSPKALTGRDERRPKRDGLTMVRQWAHASLCSSTSREGRRYAYETDSGIFLQHRARYRHVCDSPEQATARPPWPPNARLPDRPLSEMGRHTLLEPQTSQFASALAVPAHSPSLPADHLVAGGLADPQLFGLRRCAAVQDQSVTSILL